MKIGLVEKGFQVFGGDAGFYLWMSHPNFESAESLATLFLDNGIMVTPGTVFGEEGEGFVRMVYCETQSVIEEVVEKLKDFKL